MVYLMTLLELTGPDSVVVKSLSAVFESPPEHCLSLMKILVISPSRRIPG
jgi:hypothetical protein